MASIKFPGLKDYENRLYDLGLEFERVSGEAIYEAAKIVADEVKAGIRNLPSKTGVTKKGLEEGFGISKMQNDQGFVNVKLGFDGYNEKGVANVLMARILESGTSRRPKTPFIRPAVNRAKKPAEKAMQAVLDNEIEKIME